MRVCSPLLVAGLLCPAEAALAQNATKAPVALVKMPYRGERNLPDISDVPDYLEKGGIQKLIEDRGHRVKPPFPVALTPDEQKEYGEWNRLGLANGRLAKVVAADRKAGYVPVGLLANCSSIMGMLGGLQQSGKGSRPLRVGLVFIDAHADFNTPETTLSGMLGGMPVAVASGRCLTRLRLRSGLDPALSDRHIVLGGVRDVDPLEQDLLDRSEVAFISTAEIRSRAAAIDREMARLSEISDLIYVHVDMDVLDPQEVPGHPLTVPDGPTSLELGAAIAQMFKHEKAAAFGVASTPSGDKDPDGRSRRAAYNLILGALDGLAQR
jgi:arginase